MELARTVHTIRFLQPVQIYNRVWRHVRTQAPDTRPRPSLRGRSSHWVKPAGRNPSVLSPHTVSFLNQTRDIGSVHCWNDPACEKLWLDNLHYFDDLNAHGADTRAAWHHSLINRWIRENPPCRGVGWEPYVISVRAVNWIKWVLAGNEAPDAVLQSLAVQARHLESRLEWHLLGNHLLTNAKALVFLGLFFDGPEGARWLTKGLGILARQIPEQILADGGHFERSPMYHSLVLEDLLDLHNLMQTYPEGIRGCDRSAAIPWENTIQWMRAWLKAVCHPDGQIAFFNDAAWEIAPAPAELDAYALRLGHRPVPEPEEGITHLADTGFIRLRKGPIVAILDVGEIGPSYQPGHAHADTLSFELSLHGQRTVVNSGTSTYSRGSARQYQRSTAAHNTVVIDGKDSSETWAGFRVGRRAHPMGLSVLDEGSSKLLVQCAHDGYRHLPGRPVHERTWSLTDRSFVVHDRIKGDAASAVAHFYLHPEVVPLNNSGREETAHRFQSGPHLFSLTAAGALLAIQPSTFHPAFGESRPNRKIIALIDRSEATFSFS